MGTLSCKAGVETKGTLSCKAGVETKGTLFCKVGVETKCVFRVLYYLILSS